jgi:hypothetical protein
MQFNFVDLEADPVVTGRPSQATPLMKRHAFNHKLDELDVLLMSYEKLPYVDCKTLDGRVGSVEVSHDIIANEDYLDLVKRILDYSRATNMTPSEYDMVKRSPLLPFDVKRTQLNVARNIWHNTAYAISLAFVNKGPRATRMSDFVVQSLFVSKCPQVMPMDKDNDLSYTYLMGKIELLRMVQRPIQLLSRGVQFPAYDTYLYYFETVCSGAFRAFKDLMECELGDPRTTLNIDKAVELMTLLFEHVDPSHRDANLQKMKSERLAKACVDKACADNADTALARADGK